VIEGQVHPDFWLVARALETQLRQTEGGAAVCVYHRGEPVVDLWSGTRDPQGRPWEADTMAMSFSTTKGVAATVLHVLVDRGLLDYDDPVAKHWPEFAQGGKERITVRQVLCHQAALHHIRKLIDDGEQMLDWEHMVGVLERATPAFEPGTASAYHALTFGWLVGELVQRVTSLRLPEVVEAELAKPLGLDGLYIGAPDEARKRAAVLSLPRSRGPSPERYREARKRAAVLSLPRSRGPSPERYRGVARVVQRVNRTLRIPIDPSVIADGLFVPGGLEIYFHPRVLEVPMPAVNGLFTARSLARLYATLAGGGQLDGRTGDSIEWFRSGCTGGSATIACSRRAGAFPPDSDTSDTEAPGPGQTRGGTSRSPWSTTGCPGGHSATSGWLGSGRPPFEASTG
jgi:CubicO group peptidase (beta-lactamase class C family)